MKQRITIEQLQELTEEQQQRLREWWKPQLYDVFIEILIDDEIIEGSIERKTYEPSKEALPLLDIGQMIELLHSKPSAYELIDICDCMDAYGGIIISEPINNLCDALWQAVKQVL
jgi:hypothetical protein